MLWARPHTQVSSPELLSLWSAMREGAACCPVDTGRTALRVSTGDAYTNLYELHCVSCGWCTPRFLVVGGRPATV